MTNPSIESINFANRMAIQSVLPPTIRIIGKDSNEEFEQMDSCLDEARKNKADLIELLFYFGQEGVAEPDDTTNPWLARFIASDVWTDEMHTRFWDIWDGNLSGFQSTACKVINEVYPLN